MVKDWKAEFDEKFSSGELLLKALETTVYDIPTGTTKTRREFIKDFIESLLKEQRNSDLESLVGELEATRDRYPETNNGLVAKEVLDSALSLIRNRNKGV